jgi:tRNA threonylcarbamoyladenosine biosynthesis protein TsaB
MILAIETSQREASVALRDRARGGAIHDEPLSPRKRHDDDLLPAIDRMFARANLRSADLRDGVVAVSIGPGGFTGLRIAVATAKMLAETLHVKLVAVPSAVVAAEAWQGDGPILVALACKNDTFWLTRLERAKAESGSVRWGIAGEPAIARSSDFDFSGVRAVLADEHFPAAARSWVQDARLPVMTPVFSARACLLAGERLLAEGATIDPLNLLPLYPREPEAVSLWNARSPNSRR